MTPAARIAALLMTAPLLAGLAVLAIPLALGASGAPAGLSGAASCAPVEIPGRSVALSPRQLDRARTIVDTAVALHLPPQAATLALAAALQESGLRMLANDGSSPTLTTAQAGLTASSLRYPHDGVGHDHDSVNMFQQRWMSGWGSIDQLMDPGYATRAFYTRLVAVPGWQALPPTAAVQAVQHSAYGGAYARWTSEAVRLTTDLWPPAASSAQPAELGCLGARAQPRPRAPGNPVRPAGVAA